jgi:hypothetical protein
MHVKIPHRTVMVLQRFVLKIKNTVCLICSVSEKINFSVVFYLWVVSKTSVIEGKAVPQHTYGGGGEGMMHNSYSFTTSALDGGEWSAPRPGRALLPGKGPRYPLYRRLGGPQSRSGHRG